MNYLFQSVGFGIASGHQTILIFFIFRFFGRRKQWDCRGASNLEELHQLLRKIMIRRLKNDVLTQLPPKVRQRIPFDLPQATAKVNFPRQLKKTFVNVCVSVYIYISMCVYSPILCSYIYSTASFFNLQYEEYEYVILRRDQIIMKLNRTVIWSSFLLSSFSLGFESYNYF